MEKILWVASEKNEEMDWRKRNILEIITVRKKAVRTLTADGQPYG